MHNNIIICFSRTQQIKKKLLLFLFTKVRVNSRFQSKHILWNVPFSVQILAGCIRSTFEITLIIESYMKQYQIHILKCLSIFTTNNISTWNIGLVLNWMGEGIWQTATLFIKNVKIHTRWPWWRPIKVFPFGKESSDFESFFFLNFLHINYILVS